MCVGEDKATVGKMLVVESMWPLELYEGSVIVEGRLAGFSLRCHSLDVV